LLHIVLKHAKPMPHLLAQCQDNVTLRTNCKCLTPECIVITPECNEMALYVNQISSNMCRYMLANMYKNDYELCTLSLLKAL
jgi:hypothetical protein